MKHSEIILYVDDDLDDQHIFVEALKELHPTYFCYVAFNGSDALELLRKIKLPICIYLDINMPIMNGIETLRQLKADSALAAIPVFMLSTSRSKEQENEAKELGATDYLLKPNAYNEFVQILGACLSTHLK
jgi:CheY-like chemotaxis protein